MYDIIKFVEIKGKEAMIMCKAENNKNNHCKINKSDRGLSL